MCTITMLITSAWLFVGSTLAHVSEQNRLEENHTIAYNIVQYSISIAAIVEAIKFVMRTPQRNDERMSQRQRQQQFNLILCVRVWSVVLWFSINPSRVYCVPTTILHYAHSVCAYAIGTGAHHQDHPLSTLYLCCAALLRTLLLSTPGNHARARPTHVMSALPQCCHAHAFAATVHVQYKSRPTVLLRVRVCVCASGNVL